MNIIINGAEAIPEGVPGTVAITTRAEQVTGGAQPRRRPMGGERIAARHCTSCSRSTDTGTGMDEETQGAHLRSVLYHQVHRPRAGSGGRARHRARPPRLHRGGERAGKGHHLPRSPARRRRQARRTSRLRRSPVRGPARRRHSSWWWTTSRPCAPWPSRRWSATATTSCWPKTAPADWIFSSREADRIQCVVLDLTMPVMGGEETLARMKAVRAAIPDHPFERLQ